MRQSEPPALPGSTTAVAISGSPWPTLARAQRDPWRRGLSLATLIVLLAGLARIYAVGRPFIVPRVHKGDCDQDRPNGRSEPDASAAQPAALAGARSENGRQ